jgi:hypothetical protein
MKTNSPFTRLIVGLLISALLVNCVTTRHITKSPIGSLTQSELETRILRNEIYHIKLKEPQNGSYKIDDIIIKFRTMTADTIFGDVIYIEVKKPSRYTGTQNSYKFKNVSINGQPINKNWQWADARSRLIGLGRISMKSIERIDEEKISVGKTALLVVGTPLLLIYFVFLTTPIYIY